MIILVTFLREDETGFSEPPDVPTTDPWSNTVDDASGHITDLRKQMRYQKNEAYKRQLIHTLYASIKDQYGIAPKTIDYNNFALDKDGNLILKAGKTRVILNSAYNKNKFLSLRTIVDKLKRGGATIVRTKLNLEDYHTGLQPLKGPDPSIQELAEAVSEAINADDDGLDAATADLSNALSNLDAGAVDAATQTRGLSFRELSGLDEALTTYRGAKAVQEGKKVALQGELEIYRERLKIAKSPEEKEQLEHNITKLTEELDAIQESVNNLNFNIRSQVSQIHETFKSL